MEDTEYFIVIQFISGKNLDVQVTKVLWDEIKELVFDEMETNPLWIESLRINPNHVEYFYFIERKATLSDSPESPSDEREHKQEC